MTQIGPRAVNAEMCRLARCPADVPMREEEVKSAIVLVMVWINGIYKWLLTLVTLLSHCCCQSVKPLVTVEHLRDHYCH